MFHSWAAKLIMMMVKKWMLDEIQWDVETSSGCFLWMFQTMLSIHWMFQLFCCFDLPVPVLQILFAMQHCLAKLLTRPLGPGQ